MKRIVLHIGRHKTGTSALQTYFHENATNLESRGVCYPEILRKGVAHHFLAQQLSNNIVKTLSKESLAARIKKLSLAVERYVESHDSEIFLFSSEAFQNCNPAIIAKVFPKKKYLIDVVCYFRDQVSYLVSAYNQRVHATSYNKEIIELYNSGFGGDYYHFSNSWGKEFETFKVLEFNKSSLIAGDIVDDFLEKILNISASKRDGWIKSKVVNVSLSREMLAFKYYLNKKGDTDKLTALGISNDAIYKSLIKLNQSNGKSKFEISEGFSKKIKEDFSASNNAFHRSFLPASLTFKERGKGEDDLFISEIGYKKLYDELLVMLTGKTET